MRRRNTLVRAAALGAATVLAWGGPRSTRVQAQDAPAVSAPAVRLPLLALAAEEAAALPESTAALDVSRPRSWPSALRPGDVLKRSEAWPGIALLLRGDASRVEALALVAPGADAAAIELSFPGATGFEASDAGHAIVRTPAGDVALPRPGLQEETADGPRAVPGAWQDRGEGRIGLRVGDRNPESMLAIGFEIAFLPGTHDRNRDGRVTLDELVPAPPVTEGGPAVSATKRDSLATDVDLDGQADPGDTLSYDVVIGSTGQAATGVQLADPLDPNLTLVNGSINVSPLAGDDTYQAIGNVTLSVSSALAGILANDTEFLGDTFTITAPPVGVPSPTTLGGTVTVQSDGTFTYTTPAGASSGADTFTYTLTDSGGLTGSGTVTLNIAGRVWFVDRDAPAGGTGTQAAPFNVLSAVNGAGGAGDPDAANDYIYLFDRAAAVDYTGGLELEADQRLVGSGAALVVGSTTVLPAATPPTVVNTTGDALQLASGVRIEGLSVQAANDSALAGTGALGTIVVTGVDLALSGTGGGLDLVTQTGSFSFASGSITGGGTGTALFVQGGTGTVTLATSSINRSGGRLVDVQAKTGGSVTLGTLTGTGAATDAIVLANNSATTLSFPNGFNVTTTAGRGLLANNTGSFSLGGTSSTVNATGQAALEILDTTIDGTATFVSLSSTSSLGPGLRLESGVGGALVVTNGVTITNPGDVGIGIQFTTLSVTIGGTGTQISGVGDDVSLVVSGSNGNMSFGPTTITGGNDAIRLLNNPGGTRSFASLDLSGNANVGVLHNNGGAVAVAGNATLTPGGTGIDIQNSGASVTFSGVTTINKGTTAGLGLNLVNNTAGPAFATLNVTTSNGAGLAIANSPFATNAGTISATGGPAINATSASFATATFAAVSSTGSPIQGINLVSSAGTLTMNGGSISTAAGTGFAVNGGSLNASYAGTVTQNAAQRVVDVQGTAGGSISIATATGGASSTGVNINAANGNVTFTSLSLGTSGSRMTNQAVTITGGTGTYDLGNAQVFTNNARGLNAQGADGTLRATGRVDTTGLAAVAALEIDGPVGLTTLAMTMERVDASGTQSGIRLADTNGAFSVTGSGATLGSGGTIQNTSSDGIRLTSTAGTVSFANVDLTNIASGTNAGIGCDLTSVTSACESAVALDGATNVTLDNLRIDLNDAGMEGVSGFNVNGLTIRNTQIVDVGDADGESAILLQNLSGTSLLQDLLIDDPVEYGIRILNQSGTLNLTLQRTTVQNNINTFGESAFQIRVEGGASNVLVDDCDFLNTDAGIHGDAQGVAGTTLNLTVQNSTFNENRSLPHGINFTVGNQATGRLRTAGTNTLVGCAVPADCSLGVDLDASIAGRLDATVENLSVSGTGIGGGLEFISNENAVGVARVANDAFTLGSPGRIGMNFNARSLGVTQAGTLDLILATNSISGVDSAVFGLSGMNFQSGNSGVLVHNNSVCANLDAPGGNTVNGTPGSTAYSLRQRVSTNFRLEGLAPATGASEAQVEAFIQSNNPGGTLAGLTDVASAGGTTVVSYTAGVCTTPVPPTLP